MKFQIDHNARHPYDFELIRLIQFYLDKMDWPEDRISIMIRFTLSATTASSRKVIPRELKPQIKADAWLYFNYLYLQQQPKEYLTDIVPHEVAHLIVDCMGFQQNLKQKHTEHGEVWKSELAKLSSLATPSAKGPGEIFDVRPINLFQGGQPVTCFCDGSDKYSVVSSKSRSNLTDMTCKKCKGAYSIIERDELPVEIIKQYEYIVNEQSKY